MEGARSLKPPGPGFDGAEEMAKPPSAIKWKDGRQSKAKTSQRTKINGPIYGSTNLPIRGQCSNVSIYQSVALSTYQPVSLSNSQFTTQPKYRPIIRPFYLSTNVSICRSINVWVCQTNYQSIKVSQKTLTHSSNPYIVWVPTSDPISKNRSTNS